MDREGCAMLLDVICICEMFVLNEGRASASHHLAFSGSPHGVIMSTLPGVIICPHGIGKGYSRWFSIFSTLKVNRSLFSDMMTTEAQHQSVNLQDLFKIFCNSSGFEMFCKSSGPFSVNPQDFFEMFCKSSGFLRDFL